MLEVGITLGVCGGSNPGGVPAPPPTYAPSLDYSDARNSTYLAAGF